MTKDEIQQEYQKVAAQAGDVYFKLDRAQQVTVALDGQLKALKKRRAELESVLNQLAKDEAQSDGSAVAPTTPSA